ncbi:HDOD domain-containing protein [Methylomonas sp. AM2-LC]|uniref:HDOD domain-containing protein n=1 Tax=Methylomonas sp. AM2-LC TaxID=3153301 RepID=UPI0032640701
MAQVIEEETANKLLKGICIPPQPQIMVDLQMEMQMPETSLENICAIISKDIGISGCILKVVNSPFFKLSNQIASIKEALCLLGIVNIANIINSLSIRDSFSDAKIIEMTPFWDNAMDVAMTSAAISRQLGLATPDEAYTLGLFHNTGIPLLVDKHPQYPKILAEAYNESKRKITDIENDRIGTNHAVVGYFVAKAWKLPSYLAEVIASHHKTEDIFADIVQTDKHQKNLLAILKLAENTCKSCQTFGHTRVDHEFLRIKKNILIYIGLSEYDFEDLQHELLEMSQSYTR